MTLFFVSAVLETCESIKPLSWDKWSLDVPEKSHEYPFRKATMKPIKALTFECRCPPFKECDLDFKINEAVPDFLNIRGVLKGPELEKYKKGVDTVKGTDSRPNSVQNPENGSKSVRRSFAKRNLLEHPDTHCCCPPRTLSFPSFVSDQKLADFMDSFDKKVLGTRGNHRMALNNA